MEPKTKRVALATLLGVVIFLSKTIAPSPIDKMFIVAQALLLALGALLLKKMGATYVAVIGGVLTALWRSTLAPLFTFGFALLYGLFVDGFFFIFKINPNEDNVKTRSLIASMTVSTTLVGLISYYTTVFIFTLVQRNLMLEVGIFAIGTLNGAVAGYIAPIVWNKHLKTAKF